ncbi:hypothetical protein D3C72_2234670 [compost metagenome]
MDQRLQRIGDGGHRHIDSERDAVLNERPGFELACRGKAVMQAMMAFQILWRRRRAMFLEIGG